MDRKRIAKTDTIIMILNLAVQHVLVWPDFMSLLAFLEGYMQSFCEWGMANPNCACEVFEKNDLQNP